MYYICWDILDCVCSAPAVTLYYFFALRWSQQHTHTHTNRYSTTHKNGSIIKSSTRARRTEKIIIKSIHTHSHTVSNLKPDTQTRRAHVIRKRSVTQNVSERPAKNCARELLYIHNIAAEHSTVYENGHRGGGTVWWCAVAVSENQFLPCMHALTPDPAIARRAWTFNLDL